MGAITVKQANSDKGFNHKWALNILIFSYKGFFERFFCHMFFKILTSPSINYITCVNSF
jgi:hypothetical protein